MLHINNSGYKALNKFVSDIISQIINNDYLDNPSAV